jgi:hypothetical protein
MTSSVNGLNFPIKDRVKTDKWKSKHIMLSD